MTDKAILAVGLLTLAIALPLQQANSQGSTGAATSKTGGAAADEVISPELGKSIANSMELRHGYYWYRSHCWVRRADGSYASVPAHYC